MYIFRKTKNISKIPFGDVFEYDEEIFIKKRCGNKLKGVNCNSGKEETFSEGAEVIHHSNACIKL